MDNTADINYTDLSRFYRLPQVAARLNVSESSIWAWTKEGTFPKPIKLSKNCTAWIAAEIKIWEDGRIAKSRAD